MDAYPFALAAKEDDGGVKHDGHGTVESEDGVYAFERDGMERGGVWQRADDYAVVVDAYIMFK